MVKKPAKKLSLANDNLFFAETPNKVKNNQKAKQKGSLEKVSASMITSAAKNTKEKDENLQYNAQDNEVLCRNMNTTHHTDDYHPSDDESEFC